MAPRQSGKKKKIFLEKTKKILFLKHQKQQKQQNSKFLKKHSIVFFEY